MTFHNALVVSSSRKNVKATEANLVTITNEGGGKTGKDENRLLTS